MGLTDDDPISELQRLYRPGFGLPRPFYVEPDLYQSELDLIWRRGWIFAGHACEVEHPGDFFVFELDSASVIVVRRSDGDLGAYHNVCRHRGSLVVDEPSGHRQSFSCPYHQWTYGLDGSLRTCRSMRPELDRAALGLHPVHVRDLAGLIFISFASEPPPFDAIEDAIAPIARPQGLDRARIAAVKEYAVPANWKLVWENNRECYHCDANHPQYVLANFDRYDAADVNADIERVTARSAARWAACGLVVTAPHAGLAEFPDPAGKLWYAANRTPLADGFVTESIDGQRVAPLMGDYPAEDVGTLRLRTLPNFWHHGSCDHAVTTRLVPDGPRRTNIRVTWLVDARATEAADYDLDRLLPFWQLTSEQDWLICARQQRGVESRAYIPGPLSPTKEYNVANFHRWYLNQIKLH